MSASPRSLQAKRISFNNDFAVFIRIFRVYPTLNNDDFSGDSLPYVLIYAR
ncbi:hypothetical protein HMPREF0208_04641 [Citrobacter koseri]|nr:hypothetical protein HMPREF3207_03997 [Citrobacter koseri]KXB39813.1 hypothetical protein HMPREF0208_04641 [Citrobacter koseri]